MRPDARIAEACESYVGAENDAGKHYATMEIYVEQVPKLVEGAEDVVTQIWAAGCGTDALHPRLRDKGLFVPMISRLQVIITRTPSSR